MQDLPATCYLWNLWFSPGSRCPKMTSLGQPTPKGTRRASGRGPGISGPGSPPALGHPCTLSQLKDQVSRLQLRVTSQLESICHLFSKVRQDLQEHHKQVDALLQAVEAHSPVLDGQPVEVGQLSPGEQAGQGHREAPSPKTPRLPEVRTLRLWDFENMVTTRSSDWLRRPQSVWDQGEWPSQHGAPQFWQDILTAQLWQVFTDAHPCPRVSRPALDMPYTSRTRPQATDGRLGVAWVSLKPSGSETRYSVVAMLSKPMSLGQDSKDPEPHDEDTEAGDPSAPSSPGDSQEEEAAPAGPAQGPAGEAVPLLKLISWDPEDLGDTCRRPDALPGQSRRFAIPHRLQRMRLLRHREPVLATAVSSFTRHAFTCGRGGVKVWSLVGQVAEDRFPDGHLPAHTQGPGAYLRTCLLSSNSRALLTGGHNLGSVCVWDLAAPSLCVQAELPCPGLSCQALAADLGEHLAFAGFTNGSIRIWDLRDRRVVRDLSGQVNGAKSLVVKDHTIWTGGLDARLCSWDLRMVREPLVYLFESQIMSLSHSPQEDWLLLGMANGQHWLQHGNGSRARMAGCKEGAVLGLQFSPCGAGALLHPVLRRVLGQPAGRGGVRRPGLRVPCQLLRPRDRPALAPRRVCPGGGGGAGGGGCGPAGAWGPAAFSRGFADSHLHVIKQLEKTVGVLSLGARTLSPVTPSPVTPSQSVAKTEGTPQPCSQAPLQAVSRPKTVPPTAGPGPTWLPGGDLQDAFQETSSSQMGHSAQGR
ncbi:transducin-like enhancer protein 6 isoform X2 [Sciurus carolinensis]|uniref:transducin-like enhancer protein 6 isoform X2 n=1 Tax=Sciurus carolinensis TaxID=30640 RepID=UPI001FB4BA3F|nr:transducin-like enhancer protein 6 isoform X2 [Sciurus carolinensis]